MPWRPLPRIAFAIAVFPFQPDAPADLPLELGDELYIIEEGGVHGSWLRGYLVAPPSLLSGLTSTKGQTLEARVFSGIFPRSCVEIREYIGGETDVLPALNDSEHGGTNGHHDPGHSALAGLERHQPSSDSQWTHIDASGRSPGLETKDEPDTPNSFAPREGKAPRPPAPVPMLKIGDETPTCANEPLVDEIASCLREWHSTNLHELLLSRQYPKLAKLTRLMNRLDMARRQLLHGVLTAQEVVELHEKVVWDMVKGNKLVNDEIIIRDPKQRGRLLTAKDNIFEITKLTANMALLDQSPKPTLDSVNLHHLLVDVRSVVSNLGSITPQLLMYIYRKVPGENPQRLTESFSTEPPDDKKKNQSKSRTLFTDLTAMDVGELSGSDAELFLVIKVQAKQEVIMEPPPSRAGPTNNRQSSMLMSNLQQNGMESNAKPSLPQLASKASRRSLLWGANRIAAQRRKFTPEKIDESPSSASLSSDNDTYRPSTATTSSTTQPPQPSVGTSETEKPRPKQTAHRDLGVAVLKLKDILSESTQTDETVTVWAPSDIGYRVAEQEDWNPIIPEVMQSVNGRFEECVQVTQIQLHARSFVSPDVDELIRRTPTALLNVHKTPKIGFPGAPKEPRSDIYITVTEPNISLLAQFSHPERGMQQLQDGIDKQNLQLTMEVRKDNGQRVEHCIYPTSNFPGVTAWRTTAIKQGQAWKQTIRLAIPSEDVPHCHIIMSIADAPNFPFALAWMPLWSNGAFIEDGRHLPLLYIYDKVTSRQANGRGAYLDMPWDSRPNTGTRSMDTSGHTATLSIETFLCSTEITQDQVLLGILNWKQHPAEQLSVFLRQMSFVPDIELVKLTIEVFTAMFGILTDKAGQDEFEDLILANLVTVLGISRDRRFSKEPVVEKYIESTFDFPHVSIPILRSLQRLFTRTTDYQNSRHLNSTIKCANLLLRFVSKSRKQREAQEASIGITNGSASSDAFFGEIDKLFQSFQGLMRNSSPALVGSKTLLMQHVCPFLKTLGTCVDRNRLWLCGWDFVDSTNNVQGKLQLQRLAMVLDYVKILETVRVRYTAEGMDLEPTYHRIAEWISPYWGATSEVTDQYREQVRLCVSIITVREDGYGLQTDIYKTKLLDTYICLRDAGRPYKTTFTPLFTHGWPIAARSLGHECPVDEALMEITAALTEYKDVPIDPDLYPAERLMINFEVIRSIIIGESSPRSWLTLSLVHHRGALLSVQKQFNFLRQHYLPPPEEAGEFRTDLWRSLFMTLLAIIGSDNLALETFPEQKRRAVWKIAGDVREVGAGLLARCWNAIGWETDNDEKEQYGLDRLGGYQVQYVPNLVGPIVELCLSVHAGLRASAVQILQSMIISEWTLNGDLGAIQHEIIDNLDYLLKNKNVAENAQQKLFIIELMDLFEPLAETSDNELWEAFKDLISVVEDLLDLLIVVHNPETSDAFRTMNTLRLMDFLREMQKEDIFISYVHQLADSEAQSRCYKEAGLALRLHADLYNWNTNKMTEALKSPCFPIQTQFERKEALYFEMIKHFEEGAAYSCVLECYRELADHYEHTSFDFSKLARSQRSMAKVYDLISRGEGQTPRYFRVVYKGLSFPPSLRDKQFVFEGNGAERLVTFTDRLQREHRQAQIATSNDNVEGEGQFLLVTPVTPYRDLKHPLYQRTKVGFATKEHVLSASPVNFAVTTKRHSPKTGVKDQWVEKTVYTTAEVFPTILRRSEIIAEEILPLSPDQTAIERTVRKTSELWTLEKRIREGDEQSNWSLIEAIKASIDERSSTSVAQYREMLPQKDEQETSGQARTKEDPMKSGLQIALLDFTSTLRHCLNTFSKAMSSQDFQKLQNQFQTTFAPELAALQPAQGADSALALFTDPTFQVNPPTPKATGFSLETTRSEAEDVLPETTSRPKPVLNSERSRGNRLSALLKRKPSTANSNDTGPSGGFSQANGYGFGKGKTGTSGTNSSSAVNEPHGGRNAEVMSSKSSNHASVTRGQKITTSTFPRPSNDIDDQGGPVYTAITSAKDAFRNRDGRPTTSHSNGTVTTTGRRVAALRKRLSARKLGFGSDGQSDVQRWGDGDAMAVRVEVLQ